jgi:hypothetical protein
MKLCALLFAALFLPACAFADEHQFAGGEPVAVQPDKAYILVRVLTVPGTRLNGTLKPTPILIRLLGDDELKQADSLAEKDPQGWKNDVEANVVEPLADQPYAEQNGEEFLLTSLKPGVYVLGGLALANWASSGTGQMIASFCMGTVNFQAKPGVVTDLGTILIAPDDAPTTIPELANVVSGKPTVTPTTEIPVALKSLPLAPADYGAVGAFPNYLGGRLNRLAPMANVLDYDGDGHVIDLRSPRATLH